MINIDEDRKIIALRQTRLSIMANTLDRTHEEARFGVEASTRWPAALDEIERLKRMLTDRGLSVAHDRIESLKAEVESVTKRAEKWRQNYDLAVENTTLEQTARLKAEAEVERLTAENERQGAIWNEQHAHQHAVNVKLAAEVARLTAVLAVRTQSWMNTTDALSEADDRVKAAEAENARLREALESIVSRDNYGGGPATVMQNIARAALDAAGKSNG